ncbi:MAG: PD40 domain-containing protein [Planctomycetes bacterium]|nr:PD40 domain-containing protein [Planctomycetota bacterium]
MGAWSSPASLALLVFAALLISSVGLSQASTGLVSINAGGTASGNGGSFDSSVSADGMRIGFDSAASNLVANDTNGQLDVFVRDRASSTTILASRGVAVPQANGASFWPSISADGNLLAYQSTASNLVVQDTNARKDVFVNDLGTGLNTRVSVSNAGIQGNQDSEQPSISGDGRIVAFTTSSDNLVPGDVNGVGDIFAYDLQAHQIVLVSIHALGVQANHASRFPVVDYDGRHVVFESDADNLVAGDVNGLTDVFVKDLSTGAVVLASVGSAGQQANAACVWPSISGNGRFVTFESRATNLVVGDLNGKSDIFLRDLWTNETRRVSLSTTGLEGDGDSGGACCTGVGTSPLSFDGRTVVFVSAAINLAPADPDFTWDIFSHDTFTHETARVSLTSTGQEVYSPCSIPAVSADGGSIVFTTADPTLVPGDTNGLNDVFVRDLGSQPPVAFCFGDGTSGACRCGNTGAPGHGCENSRSTGGAQLSSTGSASLTADSFVLTVVDETPSALTLFLQGDDMDLPVFLGDGLRCVGGTLKRLYLTRAVGGVASAPEPGQLALSERAAAFGDLILIGASRHYQAYYRDASLLFCPGGGTSNTSNALAVVWGR